MVNSGSLGSERNGNTKASCIPTNGLLIKTSSPLTASSAIFSENDFTEPVETRQSCEIHAVVPTSSERDFADCKEEYCNYGSTDSINKLQSKESKEGKKTLLCSFPLEKVQTILSMLSIEKDENKMKVLRKVLCLYCDRTFVNVNLRLKHVERCHSSKQFRRVSLRKHQNVLTCTPCIYCDKFTSKEHTLKDLFKHLIENHVDKYFGCLSCEMRFPNFSHLTDHNALYHKVNVTIQELSSDCQELFINPPSWVEKEENGEEIPVKTFRKNQKINKSKFINGDTKNTGSNIEESSKTCSDIKNLRSKKLSVKSSRIILKRSKRLQAKLNGTTKKKRTRDYNEKKKSVRLEQAFSSKLNERSTTSTSNFINPYPEFDHFFQVKKITDHSIDNLKINSLTFDDVFDKAFFNRMKSNIQENLLHHIDGKLFKNEESENRISNFEKISNIPQETQNLNTENYGCELSLNAVAPTTLLLSNQLGDDPESQIEYGSKPSKKKTQMKKDEVHYKYFTRRKYQASILEHKENRDLSKLDMWTQYIIRNRQQKILDDKKSPKEILDYFAGEEYKNMMKREELNRILDRRGPFEDLREEVSKRAALDKLNDKDNSLNDDHFTEIGELLNDILNRVFELAKESYPPLHTLSKNINQFDGELVPAIPSYLNLRPSTDVIPEDEIDRSDKIALICSSQETENFELPGNTVRGKNEKVELTGEWARSRIYVCAACGLKLQNIKQFLEHKSTSHQYIWVQHYEFVGNQSELYTHLSIPVLGKVGVLEHVVQCKVWRRSDARSCTKCGKQCNSLGELHRHILECGGDWTWMLARKKCKYRPFGAKSRRKRRGLVKRIYAQKAEPSKKKNYKKSYLPKQKPSDADTIKRMLANLPPKRATRKIMCLKDGFNTSRRQCKTTKQSKFKCGKLIRGRAKEQKKAVNTEYEKTDKSQTQNNNYRRSLRCLNKVLTSRILDTNSSLIVKRKYNRKIKNKQKKKSGVSKDNKNITTSVEAEYIYKSSSKKAAKVNNDNKTQDRQIKEVLKLKRSSPRIEKRLEFSSGGDKMNIKHFFPVKKKKKKVTNIENANHRIKNIAAEGTNKLQDNLVISSVKNGQLNNINLRKRKIENYESNIPKQKKISRSARNNKKRKLRNNLGSTSSVVDLQVDIPACVNHVSYGQSEVNDFFDKCENSDPPILDKSVLVDVDVLQRTENTCNANKQPDDDKNKYSNQSNLENIITVKTENIEDLKSPLFHSLKLKKKARKPVRGLNDCIAMLTSKLCKNFEESDTHSILSEEVSSQIPLENLRTDQGNRSEYILKVPLFNEHFQLSSKNKQSVYSHTNGTENSKCKSITDNEKNVPVETCSPCEPCILSSNETNISDNEFSKIDICTAKKKKSEDNSIVEEKCDQNSEGVCKEYLLDLMDNFISDMTIDSLMTQEQSEKTIGNSVLVEETSEDLDQILICAEKETGIDTKITHDIDSEDEIPLSSLLKDELQGQDVRSLNNTTGNEFNDLPETCEEILNSNEKGELITKMSPSEEANGEHANTSRPQLKQVEVNSVSAEHKADLETNVWEVGEHLTPLREDVNLSKKTDVTVLTEISDNLFEYSVTVNVTTKHLESNKIEYKVSPEVIGNDLLMVSNMSQENKNSRAKSNFLEGSQDIGNSVLLYAKNCDEHMPKLEKINPITNVDGGTWRDTIKCNAEPSNVVANGDTNIDKKKRENTSECKENSLVVMEETGGNRKLRKKSMFTSKIPTKNKNAEVLNQYHITESSELQKEVNNKKTFINAKPKALECILDDVLLVLSENEFRTESNLKNIFEIENINSGISQKKVTVKKSSKKEIKAPICASEQKTIEANTVCVDFGIDTNEKPAKGCSLKELTKDQSLKELTEISHQQVMNEDEIIDDDNAKELRRSLRNSKRVTCYNETDLIDPLFDDLDSDRTISKIIKETTKDIFGLKRKHRKTISQKKPTKNGDHGKKLSGEELFNSLKTTSNENIILSKPTNTFFNTFDEISNDFNDTNFDVFEHILEKSITVIEENLSDKVGSTSNEIADNNLNPIYSICSDSDSKTIQEHKRKTSKSRSKNSKPKIRNKPETKIISSDISKNSGEVIHHNESEPVHEAIATHVVYPNDVNKSDVFRTSNGDKNKVVYCDICHKKFSRVENLNKHKRTLTHISKLSALEAREAALKRESEDLNTNEEIQTTHILSHSRRDMNLLDMLGNSTEEESKHFSLPFAVNVNNSNLKLADIINDVLNKPMLKKDSDIRNFKEIIIHNENETQPEVRRCKNLAERKSFESENCLTTPEEESHNLKSVDYFEPEMSSAAAGTILAKQITLLENIIENRSSLGFMENLSVSSSPTVNENTTSENEIDAISKAVDSVPIYSGHCIEEGTQQPNIKESFLKPSQYEEISDDSNLRNYDEQKSRKALNRDEALFVECCSLLRSGSEVSSYSKKSNNLSKEVSHLEMKPCEDRHYLQNHCLAQKANEDFVECYSDSSRIRTPLGDSFTQEGSNSATISSQWEMNNSCTISNKELWKQELNVQNKNLTFEEVFNNKTNEVGLYKENRIEELQTIVSSFDRVITDVLNSELNVTSGDNIKNSIATVADSTSDYKIKGYKDSATIDGKKVLTKGAMKIFEGLKVSIPTEELNMDKILTTTLGGKTPSISGFDVNDVINEDEASNDSADKSIPPISQSKSTVNTTTKHTFKKSCVIKQNHLEMDSNTHDVYDFEETQDNSEVFTKPDFRSFRNTHEKCKKLEKTEGSDDDSRDGTDAFSFDAVSSSTSSVSEMLPVKSRSQQNITKKKCMIMGRIFKNAVKSRILDEDIRNIPVIDNTKLVENFVLNCPEPMIAADKKPRMTEEEMNLAFDKLISTESQETAAPKACQTLQSHQKSSLKRKHRTKNKKRSLSDSSDDEFKLQVYSKKRPKKKNNNIEESCINLEQELRECIGVASRKSQRKCTSGKQNVLMEYWSSDESSFETIIEKQIAHSLQGNHEHCSRSNENSIKVSYYKKAETNSDTAANYEAISQTLDIQSSHKRTKATMPTSSFSRRKRVAANPLYHWSSSSEDESRDLIEVRPVRDEFEDDEDRPVQHGWIVGDSPKKLVTMLAQAKGKKCDIDSVKEYSKKRTNTFS